ncbi:hypothetical protein ACFVYG_32565 [Streptomyces sp. NPDC058256]|uniref:hypothetical protein n=1 Tax=Streptomyces sp. NPDC058256 TaxID=3346408 RepID=UPI0036E92253
MADRDEESYESAGASIPEPVKEPAKVPDETTDLTRGKTSRREEAYLTLGIIYYGGHVAHWVWLQVQEQLFPLVQPYT